MDYIKELLKDVFVGIPSFLAQMLLFFVAAIFLEVILPAIVPIDFGITFFVIMVIGLIYSFRLIAYGKIISSLLIVVLCVVFAYRALALFPEFRQAMPWAISDTDNKLSKISDSVDTQYRMSMSLAKSADAEIMLAKVSVLLNAGDVKGARLLKESFEKKWLEGYSSAEKQEFYNKLPDSGMRSIQSRSESATLHKGDYWFTERVFVAGERYRLRVEYSSVENVGSKETIQPGEYERIIRSSGQVTFKGLGKNSKVIVKY